MSATAAALGKHESWADRTWPTALALLISLGGMAGLLASLVISKKVFGLLAALIAYLLVAAFSGNARLTALWTFLAVMPFNLAKYFGSTELVGGEIAYRIELSDIFLAILIFYQLREIFAGRRPGLKIPKVMFWWGAIFLLGVATYIAGPWRELTGHELFRMIKMAALFVVLVNEFDRTRRLMNGCAAFLLGASVQSVAGLAHYLRGRPLGLYALGETSAETSQILSLNSVEGERVWRVSAFMWHPNIFGAFLGAVLAMALALTLVRTFPFGRVYFFFAFLLGIPALVATQSRSGWLSFAVSCSIVLLLSIFHRRVQKNSMIAIPLLLALGLFLMIAFSSKIANRLFHSKEDATIGREVFEGDAERMIAEKPIFGWGLNTYSFEVEPFMKYTVKSFEGGVLPPVHNIYLLVLAETGVVGFTFHAIIFGMLFWHAYGNLRVRNDLLYMVNAACIAGLAAVLVDGNFSFTWRINGYQKAFWVIAAMVMAIYYWRLRHELPSSGTAEFPGIAEQTVAAG